MKVKYSPDFADLYRHLPNSIQRQFKALDARVMRGDMTGFRQMGWSYYASVNDYYVALGSIPETGVFYWIWIGSPDQRPMIL